MRDLLATTFQFTSPDDRIDKATYFARCWPGGAMEPHPRKSSRTATKPSSLPNASPAKATGHPQRSSSASTETGFVRSTCISAQGTGMACSSRRHEARAMSTADGRRRGAPNAGGRPWCRAPRWTRRAWRRRSRSLRRIYGLTAGAADHGRDGVATWWPEAFCAGLAARSHHVIRSTTATQAARPRRNRARRPMATEPSGGRCGACSTVMASLPPMYQHVDGWDDRPAVARCPRGSRP